MNVTKLIIVFMLILLVIWMITMFSINYKDNDIENAIDVVDKYQNAMENYNYQNPSAAKNAIFKYVASVDLKRVSDNEKHIFYIISSNDTESIKGKSTVKFLTQMSANVFQLDGTIYFNIPSNSTNSYSVREFFQRYTVEKQKNGSFLITNVLPITVPTSR